MIWIFLVVMASILWSIVNILDKHVVSDELKDPALCAVIFGLVFAIAFELLSMFLGIKPIDPAVAAIAAITGFIYVIGVFLYYSALRKGEVSRAVPILHMSPLVVIIFATIFLGESLRSLQYMGIILLVVGAAMISLKFRPETIIEKGERSVRNYFRKLFGFIDPVFWIILPAMLIFSARNVLVKYVTSQASVFPIFFWIGIGCFAASLLILAFHHPRIFKKGRAGVEHLISINSISAAAFMLFTIAVSIGPVSVITALAALDPLFVFVLAVLLTKFEPKIVSEEMKKSTIELKILSIIIILIGTLMVL
jgi:transporter family protein